MDFHTWNFGLSVSSRSHGSASKPRYDSPIFLEEVNGGVESEVYYPCPYCSEDYDLFELCCHIDEEHPVEADSGVCPVCTARVERDIVEHITTKHSDILDLQQKLNLRKIESESSFSSSRTEVSPLDGPWDPLLSFISSIPTAYEPEKEPSTATSALDIEERTPDDKLLERDLNLCSMLEKDKVEKAERCEYIQGLIMSTILDIDS